jgi:hypothetical protein
MVVQTGVGIFFLPTAAAWRKGCDQVGNDGSISLDDESSSNYGLYWCWGLFF